MICLTQGRVKILGCCGSNSAMTNRCSIQACTVFHYTARAIVHTFPQSCVPLGLCSTYIYYMMSWTTLGAYRNGFICACPFCVLKHGDVQECHTGLAVSLFVLRNESRFGLDNDLCFKVMLTITRHLHLSQNLTFSSKWSWISLTEGLRLRGGPPTKGVASACLWPTLPKIGNIFLLVIQKS